MVKAGWNVLIHTGGTFSMGYNEREALTPLYDIRLEILAMKILELRMPIEMEQTFLSELVATRDFILEVRASGCQKKVAARVDQVLEDIAAELSLVTGTDIGIDSVMKEYRIHPKIEQPYVIDSIDFNYNDHYEKLRTPIFKTLKAGHTAIVILGSDTIESVAPLLAKEAREEEYLKNGCIIFVSSMFSFADHPSHVAKLLQAALEVSSNKVKGALVLSAHDANASCVHVHNVCAGFAKISTAIVNPYRSVDPVGVVSQGEGFRSNPLHAMIHEAMPLLLKGSPASVAPPFALPTDAIIFEQLLSRFSEQHMIFDVEAFPKCNAEQKQAILSTISARAKAGKATLILNSLVFDKHSDRLLSRFSAKTWEEHGLIRDMMHAGAHVFSDITIYDAYTELRYALWCDSELTIQSSQPADYMMPNGSVTVHYVPDHAMMVHALHHLTSITRHCVMKQLPGGVVPSALIDALERMKQADVQVMFDQEVTERMPYMTQKQALESSSTSDAIRNKLLYAAAHSFLEFSKKYGHQQTSGH